MDAFETHESPTKPDTDPTDPNNDINNPHTKNKTNTKLNVLRINIRNNYTLFIIKVYVIKRYHEIDL
jgi:hypothetical protein